VIWGCDMGLWGGVWGEGDVQGCDCFIGGRGGVGRVGDFM